MLLAAWQDITTGELLSMFLCMLFAATES